MKNIPTKSQKPFFILSLDGGGVRGLIPLTVLHEIEMKTGKPISQLFDLIVGNSTGGIIALCLAAQKEGNQPKYSAQEVLNMYSTGIPKIFGKSFIRSFSTGLGLWASKYNRANLDGILQVFFGDLRLSQVVSHAIVVSYCLTKDSSSLWTSYRAKIDSNLDILLSDAAGATSAAPTYFDPKMITFPDGSTTFEVDGGIYANNPEEIAVMEALLQNPGLKPEQIFILSLGTGRPKMKQVGQQLKNKGIFGWMVQVNLIDLILNAETRLAEFEVESFYSAHRHRIQFDLDAKNCAMDDTTPENLQTLLQVGQDFIQKSQDEIAEICGLLMQNQQPLEKSVSDGLASDFSQSSPVEVL